MNCKFNWFNLLYQVKEAIKPYYNQLSKESRNPIFFNFPMRLDKLYKELVVLNPLCAEVEEKEFIWYELPKKVEVICNLANCVPQITYNFDVVASDWGSAGVTDSLSFKNYINSMGNSAEVNDFSLVDGRLRCNIVFNTPNSILDFGTTSPSITDVFIINPDNLSFLYLGYNNISNFNPVEPLSNSLTELTFYNNQIVTFDPSIPLPSGLLVLVLDSNNITTFDPSIPLPDSLQQLSVSNNQIVTFDTSIALPDSLDSLILHNNQIVTFDPSIALPSNLRQLTLYLNDIVIFNPSIMLPISLEILYLTYNKMTDAGYTASEVWANSQPSFTNTCDVRMLHNIDSPIGTNLEAILLTKNAVINPLP